MDALLISFFLCAIATAGGKMPLAFRGYGKSFRRHRAVVAGLLAAAAIHAATAAWAGGLLAEIMTPEARSLLLACAIAASALELCFAVRQPSSQVGLRLGPFMVPMLGIALAGLGEAAPFLVLGIAAAHADPCMAGIGGWLGMAGASFAARQVEDAIGSGALRALRFCAAAALMVGAFFLAMAALRLL